MKNIKFSAIVAIILAIGFSACTSTPLDLKKTSAIKMIAVINSTNPGTNARTLSSAQNVIIINTIVNIENLQIEENSGNDGENVGNNDNNETGGKDTNEGKESNESKETGNGDILLPGPYTLDIDNGTASIGQIDVFPGTFKKVDFDFQALDKLGGNSIVVSGEYPAADGTAIPFVINSAYVGQVQMPLAGDGVKVSANNTVTIDIVFDVNAWLSGIDFASAKITNGEIIIDSANNTALLSTFELNLIAYAEQEN